MVICEQKSRGDECGAGLGMMFMELGGTGIEGQGNNLDAKLRQTQSEADWEP